MPLAVKKADYFSEKVITVIIAQLPFNDEERLQFIKSGSSDRLSLVCKRRFEVRVTLSKMAGG